MLEMNTHRGRVRLRTDRGDATSVAWMLGAMLAEKIGWSGLVCLVCLIASLHTRNRRPFRLNAIRYRFIRRNRS
jgi:hypothetical protein